MLGKIHEASHAPYRFQQTPARPPAHLLPPAVEVKKGIINSVYQNSRNSRKVDIYMVMMLDAEVYFPACQADALSDVT